MPPKFSIILPVHNGERFIASTIESVLNQTYKNFNLIILENASVDKTLEIIHAYKDERIQVISSNHLLSIEENWRRSLSIELNEYISFISHDDLIYPEFLEEIIHLIENEPEASLYQVQYHLIDEQGKVLRKALPNPYKEDITELLFETHRFKRETASAGYVMCTQDYKKVGGFPDFSGLLYADLVLWYRLTALSYKVCSSRVLAAFRLHSQSATRSSVLLDFYEASCQYLNAVNIWLPDADEAKSYISKSFSLRYRQILEDLILNYTPVKHDQHNLYQKQLLKRINQDNIFYPFDFYSRLYEKLLTIDFIYIRIILLKIILFLGFCKRLSVRFFAGQWMNRRAG